MPLFVLLLDELDYNMGRHGYVYMINNIEFENPNYDNRYGSERDEVRIREFFENTVLWKDVKFEHNLTVKEMRKKIEALSKTDFTNHRALFFFLSSHGIENFIAGRDTTINEKGIFPLLNIKKDILSLFIRDSCETLIGKPKFFIFEACRSEIKQNHIQEDEEQQSAADQTDYSAFAEFDIRKRNDKKNYKDHNESDYFVWHATVLGEKAALNPDKGTYFLQAMMDTFIECHKTMSVPQMLPRVNVKMNEGTSKGTRISQWESSPIVEPYFPEYFED